MVNLALGGLTLVVIGLALVARVVSVLWAAAPLVAIVVLAIIHDRVLKRRTRCSRIVGYYERAVVRLDNRWMGIGETGDRFQNASHPYSHDLDVFGDGPYSNSFAARVLRPGRKHWRIGCSSLHHPNRSTADTAPYRICVAG
jgi:hypothetical protein